MITHRHTHTQCHYTTVAKHQKPGIKTQNRHKIALCSGFSFGRMVDFALLKHSCSQLGPQGKASPQETKAGFVWKSVTLAKPSIHSWTETFTVSGKSLDLAFSVLHCRLLICNSHNMRLWVWPWETQTWSSVWTSFMGSLWPWYYANAAGCWQDGHEPNRILTAASL